MIKGDPPKGLEYTKKLLEYDKPATFFDKAQKIITRKEQTEDNTISQWCEILGSTKTNEHTREFLKYLIQENALKEESVKGQPPNQTETYSLDKKRLLECYSQTADYKIRRDLCLQVINKVEKGIKTIKDF